MVMKLSARRIPASIIGTALFLGAMGQAGAGDAPKPSAGVERGRYLVTIGGCNDCHTAGYLQQGGTTPESQWLTGSPVGYQGPWGTTYASNLRLVAGRMTEAEWVAHARKERLPPMPWFNVKVMSDTDLKAVYAFIRSLGETGAPAPAYVAPGGKVATPYYVFVPQVDQKQAGR
jgi:mono/diheme cytochrome c family protein